jgi:hypothetical protein
MDRRDANIAYGVIWTAAIEFDGTYLTSDFRRANALKGLPGRLIENPETGRAIRKIGICGGWFARHN